MSDTVSEIELKPGDTIGERYRIVRALGKGGIGVVYEAENTWTRRRVAIKLLQAKIANDPEQIERFRQEAQTTSGLRHPNIVDILDMGPDPVTGRLFMVQELLDGETLQALIDARKGLSAREAFDIMVPVMGALAAAHARGVLHRDIKPGNIFLAREPHGDIVPKVIDFGLARLLHDDPELRKTRTGSIVGTPYYMSPEQARGESNIDARIDVWAVGAVLHEMLTNVVPFDGENALAVMWKIATEPVRRVDALVPSVPREVGDIIVGALQTKRDERWASMRAFLEAAIACPALAAGDAVPLSILHARSLPPELARRPSAPVVSHAKQSAEQGIAFGATLPAELPAPVQPASELRNTPFGWSSRPQTSRGARGRLPLVLGALALAIMVPVGVVLLRHSAPTTSGANHTANAAVTVHLPVTEPVSAPIVVARPTGQTPESPSRAREAPVQPVDAGSPPSPVPVAQEFVAPGSIALPSRSAHHRRSRPGAPVRPTSPTTAQPTTPEPPHHRPPVYDPEMLLDNTR